MIVAVASQKGGVGKTASALALAACCGRRARTLLLDTDPQGGCAVSLGIDPDETVNLYHVLVDDTPAENIVQSTPHGFDLAPAGIELAEAELALSSTPLREYVLRRKFGAVLQGYDVVVIDTPPTLGLLTINAFAAADSVLIPVSTQLLSLRGLQSLLGTIGKLRHYGVNEQLAILGILPTKYDSRTIHGRQVLEYLEQFCHDQGLRLFPAVRQTVRFDEAVNAHSPFPLLYPDDPASQAYEEVAHELAPQA